MPLIVLSLLVQVGLIVHVIKTGRNTLWVYAIALLPPAGPLAYVVAELLPDWFGSRTARRAKSAGMRILDPDRGLRRASTEVAVSGNVDARRRMAEELYERGRFDQAIEAYTAALSGIYEHDPSLLLGLARTQLAAGAIRAARDTLERLRRHNPEYQSADARLMYARVLEEMDDLPEAEREYASLAPSYPGAEATVRYALLLKRLGKSAAAMPLLQELLATAQLAPAHYRKAQAEWLDQARRELN